MSFLVGVCRAALGIVSLAACSVVAERPLASGAVPSSVLVVADDASRPSIVSRARGTQDRVQGDFSGSEAWVSNRESQAALSLVAYGCVGHAQRITAGKRVAQGARVEYRHPENHGMVRAW